MNNLIVTKSDGHAVIQFNRPKANAINFDFILELREHLAELAEDSAVGGVILAGTEGFFSAGLDVIELYDYDKYKIPLFFEEFHRMLRDMTAFPKPLVAAITGHAPAGGCVLALPCDYRVMADGKCRIGLNEVAVNIVPPRTLYDLMAFWLGRAKAYDLVMAGALLLPHQAKAAGLIDEVCPDVGEVVARAEAKLAEYAKINPTVWQKTKLGLRAELLRQLDTDVEGAYEDTLWFWWTEESRAAMKAFVDKLRG